MPKPALARGDLRCIGATTFKEFHKHFEKDATLVRRFQKVVAQVAATENCVSILKDLKEYCENHQDVTYDGSTLEAAVHLSERYVTDRPFLDKVIGLINEVGSRKKVDNPKGRVVISNDMEVIVADIVDVPSSVIATDDATKHLNFKDNLKSIVCWSRSCC